jgi:hypothetical protein
VDDQRFDNWARSLAGNRSRRTFFRTLVGAGTALTAARLGQASTAAQRGFSGPGESCRHDNQCRAADAPLVCAWNGFGYDGDYNCCTFEGNRCGDDGDCCGLNICAGGFCSVVSDDRFASAGSGGVATADAGGGSVSIGDINSGGNTGNAISVGNTSGNVDVYGGSVANETNLSVSADGGMAIADASGGSGNIAGSGRYFAINRYDGPGPWTGCTDYGCSCWQGPNDGNPCDGGLVCCLESDNSGVCVSLYDCTGYGAPGDVCPRYCGAGNDCPSCVSGWCTWDNYCA